MSRLSKAALIAAAGLMVSGTLVATGGRSQPAPAAPKPEQACFWAHNVNGFNAPNEKTVYIRVGVNEIYRLDLMYDCTGLTFRQDIGLEREPAGDSFICNPMQATVVYHDGAIPQRCPVTAIHKLTKDEASALPKKYLP
jgi:Family of unknown function (DUF6491)